MTRSREMWVARHDMETSDMIGAFDNEGDCRRPTIPVRVTDISDEPDFKVGDRVRSPTGGHRTWVDGPPYWSDRRDAWCVPLLDGRVEKASLLTKLPRTKSVTIEGPEDTVQWVVSQARSRGGLCIEHNEGSDDE